MRPQLGKLISISGIDCSGKSTQLELLSQALKRRGDKSVRVIWFRPGYSNELDTLRALVRSVRPQALPRVESSPVARDQVFSRPIVQKSWVTMAVTDTLLQFALKLRVRLALGETVICDRYLVDAVLDLRLRFPHLIRGSSSCLNWLKAVCPKPHHQFLFTLPKEVMLARMDKKQEPFPDSVSVRDARFQAYTQLAASGDFTVIDAAQTIERVHADVLAALGLVA